MEHNFKWKNDGRTKIMIGCGTRPEIIRLAAVIKRCREYFDCCVVYYNQTGTEIFQQSSGRILSLQILSENMARIFLFRSLVRILV